MHFGALERILEQFFDDIKKVKFWWFLEIFQSRQNLLQNEHALEVLKKCKNENFMQKSKKCFPNIFAKNAPFLR